MCAGRSLILTDLPFLFRSIISHELVRSAVQCLAVFVSNTPTVPCIALQLHSFPNRLFRSLVLLLAIAHFRRGTGSRGIHALDCCVRLALRSLDRN
jgi:hypothetical protein